MGNVTRGDGTTSRQMLAAPTNATFVWVNGDLSYPRKLAHHLDRKDLRIVSPSASFHGLRTCVIVDHAAVLPYPVSQHIACINQSWNRANLGQEKGVGRDERPTP